ncbi:hypothetical protein GDO86_018976 [Hymenochirus boettgeri]|uniref:Ig-like domain-containing protein n=1 Tax=Hymenochirus boettgeri TaxID=247094 RepID=A0A8T2IFE2_9PIPI|nr:hypothetical protein GDO86_018976 [Hymenochirus boettgeri]
MTVHRDFSIEPAQAETYSRRYQMGELRVEKSDSATFKLVLSRAQPRDSGTYHCTASSGSRIQMEPGRRSRRKIRPGPSHRPHIDSQIKVSSEPRELNINSGDTLEMLCNVSLPVPLPPDVLFAADWTMKPDHEFQEQLVISMGTDGIVSLGERYTGGEVGTRHISLEKLGPLPGSYRLRIHSAQPGDVGTYSCRVRAFVSYPAMRLEQVAEKVTASVGVAMRTQDIVLQAYTQLYSPTLHRGDTAVLLCNVTVDSAQSVHGAVSWWVELTGEKPEETAGRLVASVNREGVSELGFRPFGEELSTDRVGPLSYRLRMYNIQPEDEGSYYCAVTAWVQYPDQSWYNAGTTKSNSITIYPYAQVKDMLLIPMIAGVACALFVGILILSTVTCCYMRHLRTRKR